eukprot:1882303-Prymnesium_polylepis.1
MAATSQRGATGVLRTSDLSMLLKCANGSPGIGPDLIAATLLSLEESEQRLNLDEWLSSATSKSVSTSGGVGYLGAQTLNARQVSGLLLRLCTSSPRLDDLFDQYSFKACMGAEEWLSFYRETQLSADDSTAGCIEDEMSKAQLTFETAIACTKLARPENLAAALQDAHSSNHTFDRFQFAQQLLCPGNDVVPPQRDSCKDRPLAHYWTACSHNSYIVGNQLTGRSTADACNRCGARTPRPALRESADLT